MCNILKSKLFHINNERKKAAIVAGLLFLSGLWNFSLFDEGQYTSDVDIMQKWGNVAREEGVSALYVEDVPLSERKTTYPPVYLYALAFNSWLSRIFFDDTSPMASHYIKISKTIPVLCNLFIGLVLFIFFKNKSFGHGLFAMSMYIFNPATTYVTAFWGQIDAVNALFMFLSIVLLLKKSYLLSSVFFTLAVLTKVQSIVIIPVVLASLVQEFRSHFNFKKAIAIFLVNCVVIGVVTLPILAHGLVFRMLDTLTDSVGFTKYATISAHNIWFLVFPSNPEDWNNLALDTTRFFGISSFTIGIILLSVFTLLIIWHLWKKRIGADVAAAGMTFAFFILPTQIHERYLFPFFALACLVAVRSKKMLAIYTLLTITFLFNLMWVLPFKGQDILFSFIQHVLNFLTGRISTVRVGIAITVCNLLIFLYFLYFIFCQKNDRKLAQSLPSS